jgi:hypothetical protein
MSVNYIRTFVEGDTGSSMAEPMNRRLPAAAWFDPRSLKMGLFADGVALGRVFS